MLRVLFALLFLLGLSVTSTAEAKEPMAPVSEGRYSGYGLGWLMPTLDDSQRLAEKIRGLGNVKGCYVLNDLRVEISDDTGAGTKVCSWVETVVRGTATKTREICVKLSDPGEVISTSLTKDEMGPDSPELMMGRYLDMIIADLEPGHGRMTFVSPPTSTTPTVSAASTTAGK